MKIFLLLLLSYQVIFASTEDSKLAKPLVPVPAESTFEKIKNERLLRIRGELVKLQNQVYEINSTLEETTDSVEKFKLEVKLSKLMKEESMKRLEFIETATNINISIHKEESESKKTTLSESIQAVLEPAFEGLRSISERPRKIQALKDKERAFNSDIESI